MPSERILIADDDSGMRDIIAILCARKGYATDTVADGEQAVAALEAQPYALFVLDLVMPGRSAVKVMASARSRQPDCEVILLRGYGDERSATEALRLGAYDYVEKPLDLAHASVVIERALERRRMKIRNAALLRDLQEARGEIERRRRQELDAIRQIGQALASALEGREIVEVLVQAVHNAIRCDVAAALLAGQEGGEALALAVSGTPLAPAERTALLETLVALLPEPLRPAAQSARLEVLPAEPGLPAGAPERAAAAGAEESGGDGGAAALGLDRAEHGYLAARDTIDGVVLLARRSGESMDAQERAVFGILVSQGSVAVENARLYARAHELATRDGVTGLYNHRHFFDHLSDVMARGRLHGRSTAVVMADLDAGPDRGLKAVNDSLGHLAGDALLREVGAALQGLVRPDDLVARYGGDEFAIVAADTDAAQAQALAGRVVEGLRGRVFAIQGTAARVTASVGVAVADPARDPDASSVVNRADRGLYRAKERGGDQFCFVPGEG